MCLYKFLQLKWLWDSVISVQMLLVFWHASSFRSAWYKTENEMTLIKNKHNMTLYDNSVLLTCDDYVHKSIHYMKSAAVL